MTDEAEEQEEEGAEEGEQVSADEERKDQAEEEIEQQEEDKDEKEVGEAQSDEAEEIDEQPDEAEPVRAPVTAYDVQVIAFSVIGLWLIVTYGLVLIRDVPMRLSLQGTFPRTGMQPQWPNALQALLGLALGLILFYRARGIARYWERVTRKVTGDGSLDTGSVAR
jgi:hypothetical protein